MRSSVILWTLIASGLLPGPIQGETSPPDRAAESQALVQHLVLERAAAVASVQRIADEREEQLFAELAAKDRRLRAERRTRKEAEADLAKVTADRQSLVDGIAARNRQFSAEIEEYRRQVASIADSPDPRKREALKRYAEGDRQGAFDALVAIQRAETKAVAAGWREIGALAQDLKDRGEKGTAEVIAIYEQAQTLDPDYAWGWIELRRLYQEAGRLPDARRAAEQALAHVQSDRDRSVAEEDLGEVLNASGDLAGARAQFEASEKIRRRLAEANPAGEAAQQDLSVSLNKLGEVLVAEGDLAGARSRFEQSLKIREHLSESNPASAAARQDLSVSLQRLGDVLVAAGDLTGGRARFEQSLKILERLSEANPASTAAQRDLSVILNKLGEILFVADDLAGARSRFEQSLKSRERLVEANPTSADAQLDVSVSLSKLGEVLVEAGDLAGGRSRLEQSLKIRERLAASNPASAEAQRALSIGLESLGAVLGAEGDVAGARSRFEQSLRIYEHLAASSPANAVAQRDLISCHARLASLPGGEKHWSEALRIALDLQKTGRLRPGDSQVIDALRQKVAAAENAKP